MTTDDGVPLPDFEVFIDGSNITETFEVDNKTTVNTFVFGDSHDILVTKNGYQDASQINYVVKDPDNEIDFNLPKERVREIYLLDSYMFSLR